MTLKHYAYFNMSRRTQLTTKYLFQVLAQLSENFIFIYLGLSLFTDDNLEYHPLLIMVTVLAVCAARWVAVFPLSRAINWTIRYRARRRGDAEAPDELPFNYQAMLFWAGLRGAVGVALAALLVGDDVRALKATVLVVVVLTVIIFGGTTARMLEIMGIRTGVVDEVDSDDEFDIEAIDGRNYYKRPGGTGVGFVPRAGRGGSVALDSLGNGRVHGTRNGRSGNGWASGHRSPNTAAGTARPTSLSRKGSVKNGDDLERSDLLGGSGNNSDSDFGSDIDTSDLPPPATRRKSSPVPTSGEPVLEGYRERPGTGAEGHLTASAAIRQLFSTEDPSALFRQLDEDYIKPKLLLDGGPGGSRGSGGPS